jgi:putative ATP-grasp target RiPP
MGMQQLVPPFGVRHAVTVNPEPVDLTPLIYDRDLQINLVRDGGVLMPALKHSTGQTSTSTASSDSRPADTDKDHTED